MKQVTHHESKLPRAVLMEAMNPTKARLHDSDANEGFHPDEVLDNGRCTFPCENIVAFAFRTSCCLFFRASWMFPQHVIDRDNGRCTYRPRSIAKACIKCAETRRMMLHRVNAKSVMKTEDASTYAAFVAQAWPSDENG